MTTHTARPLKHWGLERWPFPTIPQADQSYPTESQREAEARIEHLAEARRRLGVLLGEAGVGKTLLLGNCARRLSRAGYATVRLSLVGLSTRELLWQIAAGLGAAPRADDDLPCLWRLVSDRVAGNRMQQIPTLLLLDDSGQAGPDIITQLVRLARLDSTPSARWTMVLAAEPDQAKRWSTSLRELIDLRIDLARWELVDTIGYVQTALVDAGGLEPIFDQAALHVLHELSGGVARNVTRLADFALLAGADAGATTIDASLIRTAHLETNWAMTATLI